MSNVAILVGNSRYDNLAQLDCCIADVEAIKDLITATKKYDEIIIIENCVADELKTRLRTAVDKQGREEIFFYFSGHGLQTENDFYYCSLNFDKNRPNETGLSSAELHTILRLANPMLVVKVVDACNSGTLLVKSSAGFVPQEKDGFNNLIQISSCLDTQNSLTGDPLSAFTEKFRSACLRKTEGIVYYTDIIYTLRDEFINNHAQTPYFVSQGTGREQFVENAKSFDSLRASIYSKTLVITSIKKEDSAADKHNELKSLLETAELRVATKDNIEERMNYVLTETMKKTSSGDFNDFFDILVEEFASYVDQTAKSFLIEILSSEPRNDNFVTAVTKKSYQNNPFDLASGILGVFGRRQDFTVTHDLHLNYSASVAQIRVSLTPKYNSLQKLVLIVTCAPSLENCYIFEICTQHKLKDFGQFDHEGKEVVRKWYKSGWSDASLNNIPNRIAKNLDAIVREHLINAEKALRKE